MSVAEPAQLPSLEQVEARVAQLSLMDFTRMAWPIVEKREFCSNWHIEAVAEKLEAVSRGEIRRLILNYPPRHMKSLSVAVFWPVWDWLTNPESQWLFASYAEKLSKRDSLKCRRIIEAPGGRREGGTLIERNGFYGLLELLGQDWRLTTDQNEKLRFENDRTGYRIATSVGGTATGEGGDVIVIDDPHKADDVESEAKRETVIDWLDGTISTRLNDPAKSAIVVVMQRLHELDATGHLVEQGGYEHLCLPAEYEPSHPFVWPDDPRESAGELLWPDRFGPTEIDDLKVRLGSYRAAGQLQQRPSPEEGGIIKRYWWRYYPAEWLEGEEWPEAAPKMKRIWQSWDTAFTEKTSSDFTVGTLWGADLANRYLIRRVRGRWSLTETKDQVKQLTAWADQRFPWHKGHQKRMENTANGPRVLASLRDEIQGLVPINVEGRDKTQRVFAVTPQLEAGNVHVPGIPNSDLSGPDSSCPAWVLEFIDECAAFPNGAFDDQVDSMTQALDPTIQVGKRRRVRTGGRDTRAAMRMR